MTNVGNLNATLTLSQFEFNTGLKQSETAAMEFASTVEMQSRRADQAFGSVGKAGARGIVGNLASPLQQVGFAIQDFSSQFETRGWSGAIGAVTNNVQQMGSAFGPVGMAVSALGGALVGILLPRLIETGSIFGRTAEEAARAADRLKAAADKILDPWRQAENTKFDVLKGTEEQLDQRLERMRFSYQMLIQERDFFTRSEAAAMQVGNQAEAESFRKLAADTDEKAKQLQAQGKALASMRGRIVENEAGRKQQEEDKNRVKEMEEFRKKSEEEVARFRQQSMERFGTEQQKMEARHARERAEAEKNWGNALTEEESAALMKAQDDLNEARKRGQQIDEMYQSSSEPERKAASEEARKGIKDAEDRLRELQNNSGAFGARELLKAQQEAERKKLEISEMEKKIGEMGPAAGMSAGVSRDSAAGVQAINRAIGGTASEQSIAKEQLKTAKDQLKALEEIARKPAAVATFSLSG